MTCSTPVSPSPGIISPDGLTYTFKLRNDVKFHNGEVFNAAAVKATFDREADPANGTLETLPRGFDHAEVVDDSTVKIVFTTPYAPVPAAPRG